MRLGDDDAESCWRRDAALDDAGGDHGNGGDDVGEKKPLKLRTRITTSILSSILTMSYVVSGGIRVIGKC